MEIALKNIWKPAQPTELELMSAQDFDYFISFKKNPGIQTGTFATVSINIWSLKISEDYKGKTWNYEVSGNSIDVYRKILALDFIKNKDAIL